MPLDRIVTIRSRVGEVAAPGGGSWRTYGSPIGAGVVHRSALKPEPGPPPPPDPDAPPPTYPPPSPWWPDPDDTWPFRTLVQDTNLASVFAADPALLAAWLEDEDTTPQWYRLSARKLGSRLADDDARAAVSTSLAGTAMVVRGRFFGVVTEAPAVAATTTNVEKHRHSTDRWDAMLDRNVPRFTFTDGGSPPQSLEVTDPRYVWGFLDIVRFYNLSDLRVWCEVVDELSTDALSTDTENLTDVYDQRIDLTLRVRYDPLIAPFSAAEYESEKYNITAVREETARGRRRYMLLQLQRLDLAT